MNDIIHIRIHDLDWSVQFVYGSDPRLNPGPEEEYFGLTVFASLHILIRRDLPAGLQLRTLRHELTHAALFSFGLNGGGLDEEGVCNFVECHGEEICDLAQQLQQGQSCALADGEIRLIHPIS